MAEVVPQGNSLLAAASQDCEEVCSANFLEGLVDSRNESLASLPASCDGFETQSAKYGQRPSGGCGKTSQDGFSQPSTAESSKSELHQSAWPVDAQVIKAGLSILGACPESDGETYYKLSLPDVNLHKTLEFLEGFRYLQILELPRNGITSASFVGNMPYLVKLNLAGNKLTDVLGFSPVPANLQKLDLSKNQISSIAELSPLKYLRELSLSRNLISAIPKSAFQTNKFLTYLDLSYNAIAVINGLEGLPLKTLDMTHNRLTTISGIDQLEDIRDLKLGYNCIGSLSGLRSNAKSLLSLELHNNFIMDLQEVEQLIPLNFLQRLSLSHNPAAKESNYRAYTLYLLPHVSYLDNSPTPPEERVAAQNIYSPPKRYVESLAHAKVVQSGLAKYCYVQLTGKELEAWGADKPVIVLCGASGPGRKMLIQQLLLKWPQLFKTTVSHTTRQPRQDEVSGIHYYFVSHEEIEAMISAGNFLQVVNIFGNTYGTSLDAIKEINKLDRVCVCELELEGILALRSIAGLNVKFIHLVSEDEASFQRDRWPSSTVESCTTQRATPSTIKYRRSSVLYGYGSSDYQKSLFIAASSAAANAVSGSPSTSKARSARSDLVVDRKLSITANYTLEHPKSLPPLDVHDSGSSGAPSTLDFQHQGIETEEHYATFLQNRSKLASLAESKNNPFCATICTNNFQKAYRELESLCFTLLESRSKISN